MSTWLDTPDAMIYPYLNTDTVVNCNLDTYVDTIFNRNLDMDASVHRIYMLHK